MHLSSHTCCKILVQPILEVQSSFDKFFLLWVFVWTLYLDIMFTLFISKWFCHYCKVVVNVNQYLTTIHMCTWCGTKHFTEDWFESILWGLAPEYPKICISWLKLHTSIFHLCFCFCSIVLSYSPVTAPAKFIIITIIIIIIISIIIIYIIIITIILIIIIIIIIITFIQYMKQAKNYKSHKNGLFKPGKIYIYIYISKLINTSKINFIYILNSENKVDIDYKDNA